MQRFLKLAIFLIVTIFLGVLGLTKFASKSTPVTIVEQSAVLKEKEQALTTSATVVLDFGEGKISTYSNILGKTAFEGLQKVASGNNLNLDTKQYDFGVFVKVIGGVENTKDLSWIYFVNGKSPEVASDKYELKDGDMVEWKYTKPNF